MDILGLFKGGKNDETIAKIIKRVLLEYIKSEKSSNEGKVNLICGIFLVFILILLTGTMAGFKILSFIRPEYKPTALNGVEICMMFLALVIFFMYCMNRVTNVKRVKEDDKLD